VILDVFGQKLIQSRIHTNSKHIPPKTAPKKSQDRAMIGEVNRGFWLCPLV